MLEVGDQKKNESHIEANSEIGIELMPTMGLAPVSLSTILADESPEECG